MRFELREKHGSKRAKAKDKRLQTLTPADPRRTKGFSQAYTLEVTRRANTINSFMVTMIFLSEDSGYGMMLVLVF